jgi:hypothetical protein
VNYTLTLPAYNIPVTGGITKAPGALIDQFATDFAITGSPPVVTVTVTAATLLGATGQSIEYAISTGATAPANGWGNNDTFNVTSGATYYVYARSEESANYAAGTAKRSAPITFY